jgi:hypothetical protein
VAEEKTHLVEQHTIQAPRQSLPQKAGEKRMQEVAAANHRQMDQEKQSWVVAVAELVEEKRDWMVQPNRQELREEVVPKNLLEEEEVVPKHRQGEPFPREQWVQEQGPIDCFVGRGQVPMPIHSQQGPPPECSYFYRVQIVSKRLARRL